MYHIYVNWDFWGNGGVGWAGFEDHQKRSIAYKAWIGKARQFWWYLFGILYNKQKYRMALHPLFRAIYLVCATMVHSSMRRLESAYQSFGSGLFL